MKYQLIRNTLVLFSVLTMLFIQGCASRHSRILERPAHIPEGYAFVYGTAFNDMEKIGDFVFTDPDAWSHASVESRRALALCAMSDYDPPHRSPHNIALFALGMVGSFVLDVDAVYTGRDYGHSDLCFFFAATDPVHFYYSHIAAEADDNAHHIMLVNEAARTGVATERTGGVVWEQGVTHHIRIVRDMEVGTTRVYFDDMKSPVMETTDTTLGAGYVGFGSFDDTGRFSNINLWSPDYEEAQIDFFNHLR